MTQAELKDMLIGIFITNPPPESTLSHELTEKMVHMINDLPYTEWKGYTHCILDMLVYSSAGSDLMVRVFESILSSLDKITMSTDTEASVPELHEILRKKEAEIAALRTNNDQLRNICQDFRDKTDQDFKNLLPPDLDLTDFKTFWADWFKLNERSPLNPFLSPESFAMLGWMHCKRSLKLKAINDATPVGNP